MPPFNWFGRRSTRSLLMCSSSRKPTFRTPITFPTLATDYNEAQLVYQFPLAPLVLNAFQSGSSHHLRGLGDSLSSPSADTTFFNFLASHDGIGVIPASGILSPDEMEALVEMTLKHGGLVSYKTNSDGSQSPYELNITFFDAISDPSKTPAADRDDRFIGSQAIMLALAGMPGIYIHSLVGSSNNHAGVAETGRARTINRQKWQRDELQARLDDKAAANVASSSGTSHC